MIRPAAIVLALAACEPTRTPSHAPAPDAASPPTTASTWTPLSLDQARAFEVAEVVLDGTMVCARSRAGEVACWGGQFRLTPEDHGWAPPTSTPHRLEQIDDAQDLVLAIGLYVLRSDGSVSFVRDRRVERVNGFEGVAQIEGAGASLCARHHDGRVRCQPGLTWLVADDAAATVELPLVATTGLACRREGCCGWSETGVAECVGNSETLDLRAQPRRLPITGVDAVALGNETACAHGEHGTQCWGEPLSRYFGGEWTQPQGAMVFPSRHACTLTNGALTCSGGEQPWTLTNVESLAIGDSATACARLRSGGVHCWGDNGHGEFADGAPVLRSVPAPVADVEATRITAGHDDTCAATKAGDLLCWGRGSGTPAPFGRAPSVAVNAQYSAACGLYNGVRCVVPDGIGGHEVLSSSFAGTLRAGAIDRAENVCVIDDAGRVHCRFSLGEAGTDANWAELRVAEPVTSIAASATGFVFAGKSGGAYQWIDRRFDEDDDFVAAPSTPQEAVRLSLDPITEIVGHQNGGCAVTRTGDVVCWGGIGFAHDYAPVQPTVIEGFRGARGLSANHFHVCGLVGGEVRCVGDDELGQLGRGTVGDGAMRAEAVALPAAAIQVAVGAEHSCALLEDHRVFCWGSDFEGQLGQGRIVRSDRPVASVLGPQE